MQHGVRERITPTCRPPRRDARRLADAEMELLASLLSNPIEYVGHETFADRRGAEVRLFGGEASLPRGAAAFRPTAMLPFPLGFLMFNYARLRVFELARSCAGRRLRWREAKLLLAWWGRAAEARERLAGDNVPLVLSMVGDYRPPGVDHDDAVSEGHVALLNAVNGFDCSRNWRFSTYACRAILKAFSRAAQKAGRRRSMFPTEFKASLERPEEPPPVAEWAEFAHLVPGAIEEAGLTDKEKQVLVARYWCGATLEEAGEEIGVSKERARQIQSKAQEKLGDALRPKVAPSQVRPSCEVPA
jgi:RNA polymerase primary sigma factor